MFLLLLLSLAMFIAFNLQAQTIPTAQIIPYTQDFSGVAAASTTYPAGWQGWQLGTTSTANFIATSATANSNLLGSSTALTTTGGVHNYSGKLGILSSGTIDVGLGLVVNTIGKANVVVTFDIATIRNPYNGTTETRRNNVELQYRVGNTNGTFTSLTGSIYVNNTSVQTSGIVPRNGMRYQYLLPVACENQSDVQLRWVQRDSSGSGSRPSFCIDNVIVCPAPIVTATVAAACVGNNGSINLSVSGGLPPYTVAWDTINQQGPAFAVTTANKNATHPYFGVGFPVGYVLDGVQGKELNVTRGVNYTFNGTFPGHPFHITTSTAGGSFANEVFSGVTNSQLQGGAMVFTPNLTHPALLYYMCGVHLNMGWRININNGQATGMSISDLTPGKYTAAVSSADGCITTITYTIATGTPIEVIVSSNSPLCEGSTLTLAASGADFYNWNGPLAFNSNLAEPEISNINTNQVGFYSVLATSVQGCTAKDSVEVIVNDRPHITTFTPSSGGASTLVNVSGTNFTDVNSVELGGQFATPNVLNASSLEFNVPASSTSGNIILSNTNGCVDTSASVFLVINVSQLNLKLMVEGFYSGAGQMTSPVLDPLVSDTITVALYDSANVLGPASFVTSGVFDINGNGTFNFPSTVIGNRYYIVLRHRNSIETWSKLTHLFTASNLYKFTP
ncbi:MAG: SprB repeat-containing protein [Bacteroidetes bacterium]|nr:SprB repeat-containing protein [Bacteroidota bacterium]